jgi:hypothetical protein
MEQLNTLFGRFLHMEVWIGEGSEARGGIAAYELRK